MNKLTGITEKEVDSIIDTAAVIGYDDEFGKEIMGNMVRGQLQGKDKEVIPRLKKEIADLDSRKSPVEGIKNSYAEALKMILKKIEE